MIASFRLNGAEDDYRLFDTNRMGLFERLWFRRHGEELVDTMAAPYGPDVVALLETDVTYGTMGDHGGHNRLIQNIPMVFSGPGVGSRDSYRAMRLVDVLPDGPRARWASTTTRATSTERRCGCRAGSRWSNFGARPDFATVWGKPRTAEQARACLKTG